MARKYDKPLRRICVRLFDEDVVALEGMAAASGEATNVLIRQIVHSFVVQAGARLRQKIDALERET